MHLEPLAPKPLNRGEGVLRLAGRRAGRLARRWEKSIKESLKVLGGEFGMSNLRM